MPRMLVISDDGIEGGSFLVSQPIDRKGIRLTALAYFETWSPIQS